MIFLDSNVLIYASGVHGEHDLRTQAARDLVLADEHYAISVQVLQEFYDAATRKRGLAREHAREYVAEWRGFFVQPQTLELLDRALLIEERFSFRYWDCAIIAAAQISGCDTLLTEDMQHGQLVEGVRIMNPFLAET